MFQTDYLFEGVVVQWCNHLTLQQEQSGGVGSNPGRASPLERHDKASRTPLALSYFYDPRAWRLATSAIPKSATSPSPLKSHQHLIAFSTFKFLILASILLPWVRVVDENHDKMYQMILAYKEICKILQCCYFFHENCDSSISDFDKVNPAKVSPSLSLVKIFQ